MMNRVEVIIHLLKRCSFKAAMLCCLLISAAAQAEVYDLVLKNGRVMDPESGLDEVRNVGINKGKVAVVSDIALSGKQVVDVSGLVVAPGFIDMHAHGQNDIANAYQAKDGVTTALEMEIGVFPVAKWYASRKGKARINYGATVNHMIARANVVSGKGLDQFDWLAPFPAVAAPELVNTELSPQQLKQLLASLDQELGEGALGVGIGIQYIPGARRGEIYRIFQQLAPQKLPVFAHSRIASMIEPDSIDALQELIANAAVTGGSVHMMHIGSSGSRQAPTMLEMIDGARQRGIDITTEVYPYTAASTAIGAAVFNGDWRRRMEMDYSDIQWLADGSRLDEQSFTRYRKEQPGGMIIAHFIPPQIVRQAVAHPGVMIASDGGGWEGNKGHPRGAGSFSRVLGRYVREEQALTLMSAIRKMTLLPAQRLEGVVPGMKLKGRIKAGADADITIFDPESVIDKATYLDPMQYSEGVRHVLVDGVFVVKDDQLVEGVYPGQPIRRK